MPSFVAPIVTAASPVRTPARAWIAGTQGPDRIDEVETGPDCPFGVVLVGGRRAPHCHHGIADELLDGAAVASDDVTGELEVAAKQLAGVLGVAAFGQSREANEIGEQDRDDPALGNGAQRGRDNWLARRSSGRGSAVDSGAAFAAELGAGGDRGAACGAALCEGLTALDTELATGLVDLAAACAGQRALHYTTLEGGA